MTLWNEGCPFACSFAERFAGLCPLGWKWSFGLVKEVRLHASVGQSLLLWRPNVLRAATPSSDLLAAGPWWAGVRSSGQLTQ